MADLFAGKLFPETFELYVRPGEYAPIASITDVVIVAYLYDPDTDVTDQIPVTYSVPRDGHVVALCDIPDTASAGSKLNVWMTANVNGQIVTADHDVGTVVTDNTAAIEGLIERLDDLASSVDPNTREFGCSVKNHILCAKTLETKQHCIVPMDANGELIDTNGTDLLFVVERSYGEDVAIEQAFQDPDTKEIKFTTTDAHEEVGEFPFSIREVSGNRVVAEGKIIVDYSPSVGIKNKAGSNLCFTEVEPGSIVRITEDEPNANQAGLIFVADSVADQNGIASFNLPVGTYWATAYHDGLKFGAERFVISDDQ